MVASAPRKYRPAGNAVVELDAGAVEKSADRAVAAGRGDEMDDVGIVEVRRRLRPRGVGYAVVGVEVVDELEDDAVGVRPRPLAHGTGREVDLGVGEASVAAEQSVLPELVEGLAVPSHPQDGQLHLAPRELAPEEHGLSELSDGLRHGSV